MSNTAVFTPFFKNFLDENQTLKERIMKQVQKKYEQANQQHSIDQIKHSTSIMKLFKLKTNNPNDSNNSFFDSNQHQSPIQKSSNKQNDILPILNITNSISHISNKDYSPLYIQKSISNHIHNKFKLIRCGIEQQRQQNNDENQNQQSAEENQQHTNKMLQNNNLIYRRQNMNKSKTFSESSNNLKSPLYQISNKQSLNKSRNQLSPLINPKQLASSSVLNNTLTFKKSYSKIDEQKSILCTQKLNSQTFIDIDNTQKFNNSIIIPPTNQPIKFGYRIRQHASTDRQLARKSNENVVKILQNSIISPIISPEKIKMIESNNMVISELIKESKQNKNNQKLD